MESSTRENEGARLDCENGRGLEAVNARCLATELRVAAELTQSAHRGIKVVPHPKRNRIIAPIRAGGMGNEIHRSLIPIVVNEALGLAKVGGEEARSRRWEIEGHSRLRVTPEDARKQGEEAAAGWH